jgi:hypothetical protein
MELSRDKIDYDIDGAVIKIDDTKLQSKIGETSRIPKWATAYKFAAEEAETKLIDILLQLPQIHQHHHLDKVVKNYFLHLLLYLLFQLLLLHHLYRKDYQSLEYHQNQQKLHQLHHQHMLKMNHL